MYSHSIYISIKVIPIFRAKVQYVLYGYMEPLGRVFAPSEVAIRWCRGQTLGFRLGVSSTRIAGWNLRLILHRRNISERRAGSRVEGFRDFLLEGFWFRVLGSIGAASKRSVFIAAPRTLVGVLTENTTAESPYDDPNPTLYHDSHPYRNPLTEDELVTSAPLLLAEYADGSNGKPKCTDLERGRSAESCQNGTLVSSALPEPQSPTTETGDDS